MPLAPFPQDMQYLVSSEHPLTRPSGNYQIGYATPLRRVMSTVAVRTHRIVFVLTRNG